MSLTMRPRHLLTLSCVLLTGVLLLKCEARAQPAIHFASAVVPGNEVAITVEKDLVGATVYFHTLKTSAVGTWLYNTTPCNLLYTANSDFSTLLKLNPESPADSAVLDATTQTITLAMPLKPGDRLCAQAGFPGGDAHFTELAIVQDSSPPTTRAEPTPPPHDCLPDYKMGIAYATQATAIDTMTQLPAFFLPGYYWGKAAFSDAPKITKVKAARDLINEAYAGTGNHLKDVEKKVERAIPGVEPSLVRKRIMEANASGIYCSETKENPQAHLTLYCHANAYDKESCYLLLYSMEDMARDLITSLKQGWKPATGADDGINSELLQNSK
jgi:hypothetical protein